jgi:hypothetical protein
VELLRKLHAALVRRLKVKEGHRPFEGLHGGERND